MKTVAFHTLGCRLNQAETAKAADDLARHGYAIVEWGQPADVLVINSCAVTGVASQKTRQAVRQARRQHPGAFLVLMGCDAKIDAAAWSADGPDLVLPHPRTAPLSELIPQDLARPQAATLLDSAPAQDGFTEAGAARFAERTRANLKVQDGCNFWCTYCVIPQTRGRARSRDLQDTLREAQELLDAGYNELVLCGVNVTTYDDHGCNLAGLLRELLKLNGDFRIRIGSAEPGPVIPEVVRLMHEEPRICRFLHLPLQYGEDSILKRMHRHYTAAEYTDMVQFAAETIPGICLGTDVIVGFPGEDDARFAECEAFLRKLPLNLLHVFPFSPRPGTLAATYPDRPRGPVVNTRVATLLTLANEKAEAFARSQIGQDLTLLVEETSPHVSGWTDNYLHVTLPSCHAPRNSFLTARITDAPGKRELLA